MRKLSLIFLLAPFILIAQQKTPSPHGEGLKASCDQCHSAKGWVFDKTIYSFDHNKTALPLTGQHQILSCRSCHQSLIFSDAKTACIDCHTDIHNQTVGPDCQQCHTPKSWIIENITELHQRGRFPLVGPHYTAQCSDCHKSASLLQFDPLPVDCFNCHQENYYATTQPNHVQSGYSTNCTDCHSVNSFTWGATVDHSFFPLTLGHAIDCRQCHTSGSFDELPTECVTFHQAN